MLYSPLLSVVLCLAFVASTALAYPADNKTVDIEVITAEDVPKFKDLSQRAELIQLGEERKTRGLFNITYTLGNPNSTDNLAFRSNDSISWTTPQSVRLRLQYPKARTGEDVVTYVHIEVIQSSDTGHAYVTSGGIGQRTISIIVEAIKTFIFRYDAKIFTCKEN